MTRQRGRSILTLKKWCELLVTLFYSPMHLFFKTQATQDRGAIDIAKCVNHKNFTLPRMSQRSISKKHWLYTVQFNN